MYRPQYAYPTPKGFRDEQFHYTFSAFNTPMLNNTVAAGSVLSNIPLVMQTDAPFLCRGLKVAARNPVNAASQFLMQLKDPWGNYLSNGLVPVALYCPVPHATQGGTAIMPFEAEIRCPLGAVWWLWLQNNTLSTQTPPEVSFYGVKRFREAR